MRWAFIKERFRSRKKVRFTIKKKVNGQGKKRTRFQPRKILRLRKNDNDQGKMEKEMENAGRIDHLALLFKFRFL